MTCNVKRGNDYVPPFVFRQSINDEIRYYSDGTVEWTEDPGDDKDGIPYVNRLGLNFIDLRLIRCVWFYLCSLELSCDEVNKEHVQNVIIADIDDDTKEGQDILEGLKRLDADWTILNDFQYFNNISRFTRR